MTDRIIPFDAEAIPLACQTLRDSELVVLPTDTVYGVAASARLPEAIARLYEAKARPLDNPIPLLLSDADYLETVCVDVPESAYRLAEAFWPGPLTMALPKRPDLPAILTPLSTVGVRIPAHDLARAVIRAMGGALAVTSANLSGGPNPLTAQEAFEQLGAAVTLYLDGGPAPDGIPSTVITLDENNLWQIAREGSISATDLRAVLGDSTT